MTSHEEFYLDELPQNDKQILSVSDLNQLAKTMLEENFSNNTDQHHCLYI